MNENNIALASDPITVCQHDEIEMNGTVDFFEDLFPPPTATQSLL